MLLHTQCNKQNSETPKTAQDKLKGLLYNAPQSQDSTRLIFYHIENVLTQITAKALPDNNNLNILKFEDNKLIDFSWADSHWNSDIITLEYVGEKIHANVFDKNYEKHSVLVFTKNGDYIVTYEYYDVYKDEVYLKDIYHLTWEGGNLTEIEVDSEQESYVVNYDSKPNALSELPFINHKNNVTSIKGGDRDLSIYYEYDDTGKPIKADGYLNNSSIGDLKFDFKQGK